MNRYERIRLNIRCLTRIPLLVIALAYPVAFAGAASETATPADQASSQESSQSPEFKAAEDGAQRYIAAYNKGDAKTLADFYAEDCDYIDKDGAEVKGRDAIQKLLADNFQANPGIKLDVTIDEVKQLTPDVHVNRGIATGLQNLTQDVASCLVHFGPDTTQTWLLVRLKQPEMPNAPQSATAEAKES